MSQGPNDVVCNESGRDPDFALRRKLQAIHNDIANFKPLTTRPTILDSSVDAGRDDDPWLQQEIVPGLKNLRQAVKRDLDVLEAFLADLEQGATSLSTNAPYLIAVWNEVVSAAGPVVSIFKSFSLSRSSGHQHESSSHDQQRRPKHSPEVKVDVVADCGRHWIRVNTVKNARLLAEFREIDSYLTSSDSESEEHDAKAERVDFDNSILRMGRSLLSAAQANPLPGTNDIPHLTLRLTRLDPNSERDNDPRISRTIHCLHDMGIDVQLGEKQVADVPATATLPTPPSPPRCLTPTNRINIDLSVLIALVSDLTHAPLPSSVQDANARFVPPQRYREWKKTRLIMQGKKDSAHNKRDGGEQTRALAAQVLQEMQKGLIQEMFDKLSSTYANGFAAPEDHCRVEFWTTPEARDRCLQIVSKIGGENEKRRAHALFPPDSAPSEPLYIRKLEEAYWKDSRYAQGFIPLVPLRLHSSSTLSQIPENLPPFFASLSETCQNILLQETTAPHPLPDDDLGGSVEASTSNISGDGEIRRAAVTKANPRLTTHTVQSMLCGAAFGWTTLTANRSGVRSILREVQAAKISGVLSSDSVQDASNESEMAAIWIVDPRSLAEGLRSDADFES